MAKLYSNRQDLSTRLLKGVETLAENVGATLGPKGRNVILQKKVIAALAPNGFELACAIATRV